MRLQVNKTNQSRITGKGEHMNIKELNKAISKLNPFNKSDRLQLKALLKARRRLLTELSNKSEVVANV